MAHNFTTNFATHRPATVLVSNWGGVTADTVGDHLYFDAQEPNNSRGMVTVDLGGVISTDTRICFNLASWQDCAVEDRATATLTVPGGLEFLLTPDDPVAYTHPSVPPIFDNTLQETVSDFGLATRTPQGQTDEAAALDFVAFTIELRKSGVVVSEDDGVGRLLLGTGRRREEEMKFKWVVSKRSRMGAVVKGLYIEEI
ncbi:hypothetical protein C8J57DRAFT_1220503 [Mycena rebaudengoi]|nr:hypothetical protein C8J57DRAFT_1220503 [Mycena rebaudengoi]